MDIKVDRKKGDLFYKTIRLKNKNTKIKLCLLKKSWQVDHNFIIFYELQSMSFINFIVKNAKLR